jgi:hypothetical protein
MRASLRWAFPLSIAALSLGSCNHQARQDTTARPGSDVREPNSRTHRAAVNSIAQARCQREERCGNIGVDEKFASESACVERIRADWADDLNAYDCPGGVNKVELDECLEDIRDEDCGDPFDTLARTLACGRAEICEREGS